MRAHARPAARVLHDADSVEDMEAIRRAAGVERLTLFGISYGTELALAYARAHPDRVERLILDSTVDPDDADPFGLAGFRAMTPTLRALCPDGCAGLTPDPAADLAALVARLRRAPLRGTWYTARGERRRGTVTPVALADLMYDADYNPALRAALPVAVRAALDHDDAALLLRLLRVSDELRAALAAARVLGRPVRHGVRGDAAAVAARDAARPAPRGRPRAGARAARRRRSARSTPRSRTPTRSTSACAGRIPRARRAPPAARTRRCPRCCSRARRTCARRPRPPRGSRRRSRARSG